ncbi:MAG: ubiquinol-cytochrome C chaperone family protein [Hyphomicrobium sp.]|uniref:ubiquinol-cytochrome C chaperone family protein n=1 Tax=Hyphomicrobium sp. TaxID=82 RepID=UPI003D0DE504
MAQARRPVLFACHGASDTPEGRTSLIILVMFPVLERLQQGGPRGRRIARLLIETFVTDIDDSLREMGVGDLSVPKKVKRAAQALGERCLAYRRAVRGPEPVAALAAEIAATVPGLENAPAGAAVLARVTIEQIARLEPIPVEEFVAARLPFADPSDTAFARYP